MGKKRNKGKYADTVLTPKTDFPMRASLIETLEPEMQARWEREDLYGQIRAARAGCEKFILHDGPPYATGDLHVGTAMNKVLKDFVVRYATMCGFDAPYLPGWDCHGLPIEHRVATELGDKFREMPIRQIRQRCHDYAMKFMDRNRTDFKRLGILGEWATPYLTVEPQYEAGVVDIFAELVERGYVYRALRPIHWCMECQTALAEAELEYADATSPSVYVRFPMVDSLGDLFDGAEGAAVDLLIWTTTPWTLPANLGVAVHPRYEYTVVRFEHEGQARVCLLADERVETVLATEGVTDFTRLGTVKGERLAGRKYRHPFVDRQGPIILADYVTLTDGTGCVHTAPGHGTDDFYSGQQAGLEAYSPVDDQGRFTADVPEWEGQRVFDADPRIVEKLKQIGALFHHAPFPHSYPHCWRCHNPVIFRATEQWFIKIDHQQLRARLLEHLPKIKWYPGWAENRMRGMIENRPDWCISRQRSWGVPIPGFHCQACGTTLINADVVRHVRDLYAEHGAGYWFDHSADELLPPDTRCAACGKADFGKENDTFDVWFESGASHRSVLKTRDHLRWPADVYLEGTDQHRGWFQVSYITAMAAYDAPPFKQIITNGFVVDEDGQKMSKSRGSFITVGQAVSEVGAEMLRLWTASANYHDDLRCSIPLMRGVADEYRRIRNTIRFLLGNLDDYEPPSTPPPFGELEAIERYMLLRLNEVVTQVRAAYDRHEFHTAFRALHNFCAVDLSAFYLDVRKDRCYCDPFDAPSRRQSQWVMATLVDALVRLVAPILVHTTEQAWSFLPGDGRESSVHLARMPEPNPAWTDATLHGDWAVLAPIRDAVLRRLEALRQDGTVGQSLEARLGLFTEDAKTREVLSRHADDLATIFIVSEVELLDADDANAIADAELPALKIRADHSDCGKCARCWRFLPSVGRDADYDDLCDRCVAVMRAR